MLQPLLLPSVCQGVKMPRWRQRGEGNLSWRQLRRPLARPSLGLYIRNKHQIHLKGRQMKTDFSTPPAEIFNSFKPSWSFYSHSLFDIIFYISMLCSRLFSNRKKICLCILIWPQSVYIKVFVTFQKWLWLATEPKIPRYKFSSMSPSPTHTVNVLLLI